MTFYNERAYYRTRTYIAADWTNDKAAVDILIKWNESDYWGLSFLDAHELSQCRDDKTNNCNIKKNCSKNLDRSKYFVLIIGDETKTLHAGYCMYCKSYKNCDHILKANKSFVEYECDYAVKHQLPTIVLYNSIKVDKEKCIDSVVKTALTHTPMLRRDENHNLIWNYENIKYAFSQYLYWLGIFATLITVVSIFPLNISEAFRWIVLGASFLLPFLIPFSVSLFRKNYDLKTIGKTKLSLSFGDLFKEKCFVVTTDIYFDVKPNGEWISPNSLLGKFVDHFFIIMQGNLKN